MKNKLKKYSVLFVALIMITMTTFALKINAAEPTTGSITIICHEQPNGEATNTPIKGVEYRLRKVDNDATLEDEEKNLVAYNYRATTDENGQIVFNNLEEGRYFAFISNDNINVPLTDINTWNEHTLVEYENFLVDIPMTNAQGTGVDYDIVVEPKVKTVYGNFELTKTDMLGNPMEGVEFELEVLLFKVKSDGTVDTDTTFSYVNASTKSTLTTDENGKIRINNLTYKEGTDGDEKYWLGYEIIEKYNPNDEYIVNSGMFGERIDLYVDRNGIVRTNYTDGYLMGTGNTGGSRFLVSVSESENLTSMTLKNEKPNISKKVINSNGELVDSIGANLKDTITFNITVDVPLMIKGLKTFIVQDTLSEGLILDKSSLTIQGATSEGFETIPENAYTLSEEDLKITFNRNELCNNIFDGIPKYDSIIITYNAKLNEEKFILGGEGNINTASLTYTNVNYDDKELSTKTISDSAEVHTGAVKIEKTDKLDETVKLPGAKFKVATTEANAKAGIFVTDENDTDIEVTTDTNGLAEIKGLAYADNGDDVSYWLVETEAPKYKEVVDGVETEKSYNLLKNPVEVKVGKTTHNTAVQIKNAKGINLPLTGGIGIAIFAMSGIGVMTVALVLNKKKEVIEK